jgi:hypothetical protein
MTRTNELLLNFALNAGWQIVVIFIIASLGSYFLKNAPANFRHALWLVALVLSLAAPLWTMAGISPGPGSALARVKSTPSLAKSVFRETPQITNDDENDPGRFGRLLVRRAQVVNATPRNLLLLSAALTLFVLLRSIRLARLWLKKERLRRSAVPIVFSQVVDAAKARCQSAFGCGNFRCSVLTGPLFR